MSSPDEADRPAPHSAKMRVEDESRAWKSLMEVLAWVCMGLRKGKEGRGSLYGLGSAEDMVNVLKCV